MDLSKNRKQLIESMKQNGSLNAYSVEQAFLDIKREEFFSEENKSLAYEDNAFPSQKGQTISQPSTIAIMLELLDVKKGMEILEIGAGTGYLVALLSHLTEKEGKVFGIEYIPQLAKKAVERLLKQKIKNFEIIVGNGRDGLEKNAPFDRIILSAACDKVPKKLFSQLKENGKLVAPIGTETHQELICFQKKNGKIVEIEKKSWFVFVPLVE